MSLDEYVNNSLWPILVDTVHAIVMYPHHKAYTRKVILSETPKMTPVELATRMSIPLGEALVILSELTIEKKVSV